MAVYRKKLVDKDGNTIIPAVGDIYGPVYIASFQGASGGIANYTFTPDTPVEASRVYAVKFPAPSVNNATIILGDGTTSASVLVPPVVATNSPNYMLLDTTMINDTEPLLLMYNGVQWICLNQKKSIRSGDINWTNPSVTWTSGTYASGYKASSNDAYLQGIQACIYNGFLIVRFGVSKTSGSFAANSEVGIGSIPSTIDGVDISNLATGSSGRKNLYRTSVSGSGGAIGFGQFNGNGLSVCPTTTATWLAGQFIIPLNW